MTSKGVEIISAGLIVGLTWFTMKITIIALLMTARILIRRDER